MSKVEKQTRENDILLGFLERPALKWLAEHMPPWITPDVLTWIGIFASILVFISYVLTWISPHFLWLASFGFILNWFGDSLDGTLARYRHVERPRYGFLVDHWVDAISVVLIFLGLGISQYVDLVVACMGIIVYLLIAIMVYLITYVTGVFQMTSAKFGPTEARVVAILLNTLIFVIGNQTFNLPYFGETTFYTVAVAFIAFLGFIYFMVNTGIQSKRLALLDQKRLERRLKKEQELANKTEAASAEQINEVTGN